MNENGDIDRVRSRLRALVGPVKLTMSQRDFAKKAGVSPATICRFLQGKHLSVPDLLKVCTALNVEWKFVVK